MVVTFDTWMGTTFFWLGRFSRLERVRGEKNNAGNTSTSCESDSLSQVDTQVNSHVIEPEELRQFLFSLKKKRRLL